MNPLKGLMWHEVIVKGRSCQDVADEVGLSRSRVQYIVCAESKKRWPRFGCVRRSIKEARVMFFTEVHGRPEESD